MPYFFLMVCLASVAILLYLTFFFFRIIVFLVGDKHKVLLFLGSLVFTAGFMVGICLLTRIGPVILIYLGLTALGTDLVYRILGNIKTELGIYYVYGNHDRRRYASGSSGYTEEELSAVIRKNGIRILLDEIVTINDEIVMVGRDDKFVQRKGGRDKSEDIMKKADLSKYVIVAQHVPEYMLIDIQ